MPAAHANLSPSASERWINCPASIRLAAEHATEADDEESSYAREGTLAHALAEIEASQKFGLTSRREYVEAKHAWIKEFEAENYDEGTLEEMQSHVKEYCTFLAGRLKERRGSRVMLEQRMDSGVPECWGTSDAVIFSENHIEIVDFKYGAGVRVSAWENPQLRLYGCGALDTFGDILGDTETVTCTVYQPRMDNVDSQTLTADELRAWREETVIPAALETRDPNARFGPSEEACRWCPVKNICRARMEVATQEDFGRPIETISPEEMSGLLERLPLIKQFVSGLEAYALDMAYSQGQQIPGWKVVQSGGTRYITEPMAAIQYLIDEGYSAEQVADFKIKGFGELEKLFGSKAKNMAEGKREFARVMKAFIDKKPGKPSLVPEHDKRAAITPNSDAATDFNTEDLL